MWGEGGQRVSRRGRRRPPSRGVPIAVPHGRWVGHATALRPPHPPPRPTPQRPGRAPVYARSWAAAWNAAGYSVAALDARGAGFSDGVRGLRCYTDSFDDYVTDVRDFAE